MNTDKMSDFAVGVIQHWERTGLDSDTYVVLRYMYGRIMELESVISAMTRKDFNGKILDAAESLSRE